MHDIERSLRIMRLSHYRTGVVLLVHAIQSLGKGEVLAASIYLHSAEGYFDACFTIGGIHAYTD